jgi:hypothetical protein
MSEQPARWRRLGPASALILASLLVCTACSSEADRLDAEAQRLCAIDGGIKVYETVVLPPDKFNEFGQALVPIGKDEEGWGYHTTFSIVNLTGKFGVPTLEKETESVVRTSDSTLIAESVVYRRLGGGLLDGYLHGSGFHCPPAEGRGFLAKVFIQRGEK